MTVRELAKELGVSYSFTAKRTRELFPGVLKQRIKTHLTAEQVSAIKTRLLESQHLTEKQMETIRNSKTGE